MKIIKQFNYYYKPDSFITYALSNNGELYYSYAWSNDWIPIEAMQKAPKLKEMLTIIKEFGHLINLI